jgi:hypothetical protein
MSSALGDKKGRVANSSDLTRLQRESAVLAAYTTYTGLSVNKKARQQVGSDRKFTLTRGGLTLTDDSTTGITRNPITGEVVVAPYTPVPTSTPNEGTQVITAALTYLGSASLSGGISTYPSLPLVVVSGSTIYVAMNRNDSSYTQFFTLPTSGGTASSYAVSGITLPFLSRMIIGNDNKLYAVRSIDYLGEADATVYSAPLTTGVFASFSSLGVQNSIAFQAGDTYPSGATQSPSGIFYFVNDDKVVSVSANGADVNTILASGFYIGGLVYAKDGYIYAYTSNENGIIKINPTTGESTTLVSGGLPFLYGIVQGPGDNLYGVGLGGVFAITLKGDVTNILPDYPSAYFVGIAIGPDSALYICTKGGPPTESSVGTTYISKLLVTISYV